MEAEKIETKTTEKTNRETTSEAKREEER